jgi:hypothetical protein
MSELEFLWIEYIRRIETMAIPSFFWNPDSFSTLREVTKSQTYGLINASPLKIHPFTSVRVNA